MPVPVQNEQLTVTRLVAKYLESSKVQTTIAGAIHAGYIISNYEIPLAYLSNLKSLKKYSINQISNTSLVANFISSNSTHIKPLFPFSLDQLLPTCSIICSGFPQNTSCFQIKETLFPNMLDISLISLDEMKFKITLSSPIQAADFILNPVFESSNIQVHVESSCEILFPTFPVNKLISFKIPDLLEHDKIVNGFKKYAQVTDIEYSFGVGIARLKAPIANKIIQLMNRDSIDFIQDYQQVWGQEEMVWWHVTKTRQLSRPVQGLLKRKADDEQDEFINKRKKKLQCKRKILVAKKLKQDQDTMESLLDSFAIEATL